MESDDPRTHLMELKHHFELMSRRYDNLTEMGSTISTRRFATMIMSSMPPSYQPAIQTITAAERLGMTQGTVAKPKMSHINLIAFFTEEAEHNVIDDDCSKMVELALVMLEKRNKKSNGTKTKQIQDSDLLCLNCNKAGHIKANCWATGGGKEGQGPKQKPKKAEKPCDAATVAQDKAEDEELFAFTCASVKVHLVNTTGNPRSWLGMCIDSGASRHYCPDRSMFVTYKTSSGHDILAADGCMIKGLGIGDVRINLPNGSGETKLLLKDTIYAPDMAFTLISISQLDHANCSVTFKDGMCTVKIRLLDFSNKPACNGL